MNAGFRLQTIELRNWGTFNGDQHYVININGDGACFTGLNGSGKSTVVDAMLTLLVPHEFRHFNVAATGAGAKRERNLKSYILGAYSKEESVETSAGQTKYLRRPGVLTILLATFRDETFGRFVTLAQIHWVTANGEHQGRYLIKESEAHITDLGIANLSTPSFSAHFQKNGWHYDSTFASYLGKLQGLLRIPNDEALRLFCKSVSLKDVPSVTDFVRTLMLEPQNTAEYLDGIEKHFRDLDHIHSELMATKAEIEWLEPVEVIYREYKTATDEVERLTLTRRAANVLLAREAGELLDSEIDRLTKQKVAHEAEAARLKVVLDDIQKRILGIEVSLRTNDTFAAVERLREEIESLGTELGAARKLLGDLTIWLAALNYKEPITTQTGFSRLQAKAAEMLGAHTTKHESLLEQRGATLQQIKTLRDRAKELDDDIVEMGSKRTKIDRRWRDMRDEICRELQVNEGLLPFVGELLDVPQSEAPWRRTIEVLLNNFARSVVVPEDLYSQVAGYVENSQFRHRFVYYRAPRGTGANATLDNSRIYGKLEIRPDAWCRNWLQQVLIRDFDHRCCDTIDAFRAERGRAATKNMHVKGGERAYKESGFSDRDFDILGWSNESKIAELKTRVRGIRDEIAAKEASANSLTTEAKGIAGGLGLVRQITQISSFRAIDVSTIETEITIATDRRNELEESDSKLKELNDSLAEAKGEYSQVNGLRDAEVKAGGEADQRVTQTSEKRVAFGKRFNEAAADFDWKAWQSHALEFRGETELTVAGLNGQIDAILNKIDVRSNAANRAATNAERDIGPKITEFLAGTKTKGYSADWSASVRSAPAMIEHLNKLRNERFHVQEAQFKEQMDRVLEEDIDFAKHELRNKQNANHERIKELNRTLLTVDYNDGTYVEIRNRASTDPAVANFRAKIEECTRRVIAMSPEQRTERFKAVKDLINYIRDHRTEAERGANPNNWDVYVLAELRRENPEIVVNWHTDSDGNSGGQKAKLACTIVAAAMAFRMNHTRRKDSTAFRLVMVDEIFAKSDDVNSAYALRIFEQFDFQLLLVTPRDGRLKLVTPYVGSFHLFQNPTSSNSTVVGITAAQVAALQDSEHADTN